MHRHGSDKIATLDDLEFAMGGAPVHAVKEMNNSDQGRTLVLVLGMPMT